MSDQASQGSSEGTAQSSAEQVTTMLQNAQQGPGTTESQGQSSQPPETSQQQGQQAPAEGSSTLSSDFLKDVPEEHRAILEPYVKKWDAGVTRRFTELHSRIDPYRPILDQGIDPTDLTNAVQIYQLLDTNPNYLYQLLKSELEPQQGQQGQQGQGELGEEEEFQLPPQYQQKLDQLTAVVEALAQNTISATQAQQQAAEDKQLEDYLGLLKQEKGDFDEEFVLSRMFKGMSGADAVDAWNALIQERLNAAGNGEGAPPVPGSQNPPILSGGGTVPVTTDNIGTAESKDVKGLVAQMLANAQQNRS